MKLIARYNRVNLPVLLFIFVTSSAGSYLLIRQALLQELDQSIKHTMREIRRYVTEQKKIPVIIPLNNPSVEFIKINSSLQDTGFQTINPIIAGQKRQHLFRKLVAQLSCGGELYQVVVSSPLEGIRHVTTVILSITVSAIFLIILVSLLSSRYILSKLWLPFYQSLEILRGFKIDQPVALIFPVTKTDEFNFLIDSLKSATSKEAAAYQSLKEFTENASHEIQTPLAIIRSKLDILIQKEELSEQESETSKSLYSAIDKLSRLSKSLLLITKIENRKFEEKRIINLNKKITGKVTQFRELWQMKQVGITTELKFAEIMANENLVDILLNNLLSNATKHNLENGLIIIDLKQGCLTISNTGPGIPLDHQRLFERFYKGAQHSDSNGLGLTIIKQICDVSGIAISYQFVAGEHIFILQW